MEFEAAAETALQKIIFDFLRQGEECFRGGTAEYWGYGKAGPPQLQFRPLHYRYQYVMAVMSRKRVTQWPLSKT